jgi:hypothetical protein
MNFRVYSNTALLLLLLNLLLGPSVLSSALCSQTNRINIQIFWDICALSTGKFFPGI